MRSVSDSRSGARGSSSNDSLTFFVLLLLLLLRLRLTAQAPALDHGLPVLLEGNRGPGSLKIEKLICSRPLPSFRKRGLFHQRATDRQAGLVESHFPNAGHFPFSVGTPKPIFCNMDRKKYVYKNEINPLLLCVLPYMYMLRVCY